MIKNIFCEIEYLGGNYFGFQVQNKKGRKEATVQKVIEGALKKLFKKKIRIAYSSRTDRGVHAKGQSINFKVDTKIHLSEIKRALNAFLPEDVYIRKIKLVSPSFHARFSAKSKVYRYLIFNRKSPSVFWRKFSWFIGESLNLYAMQKVSKKLLGRRDFAIFAKDAKKYKDCRRIVKNILIKKRGYLICVDIEADGFLRKMARNLVLFLVKVGREKIAPSEANGILKEKISYSLKPAPAHGLYLWKVKYK